MLGHLQEKIIERAKVKGYISVDEVSIIYKKNIQDEMNKLVALGYFKQPEITNGKTIWRIMR